MEKPAQSTSSFMNIHRGIWGTLQTDTELPVGGSIFSAELTTKLFLDFEAFEDVESSKIDATYESSQDKFQDWYKKMPERLTSTLDAKIYLALSMLQNGIKARLKLDTIDEKVAWSQRMEKYSNNTMPLLSDFKDGTAFCAEIAALAQYFLQNLNIPSVYMSGITYFDDPEISEPHSWIVLYPNTDNAVIWDIARPDNNNLPNLYKNSGGISQAMFQNTENAYIKASKLGIFEESQRYFGVSDNPRILTEDFVPNIVKRVEVIIN